MIGCPGVWVSGCIITKASNTKLSRGVQQCLATTEALNRKYVILYSNIITRVSKTGHVETSKSRENKYKALITLTLQTNRPVMPL